jgi:hypothetical protein
MMTDWGSLVEHSAGRINQFNVNRLRQLSSFLGRREAPFLVTASGI